MGAVLPRTIESRMGAWALEKPNRPLLVRGPRRVGKTYSIERIGRELAGDQFAKLDFQTDLESIAPLFDGPTDGVDAIVSRIADYKRMPLRKDAAFLLFDEVQLCERALNSLRFFSGSGWRVAATGSQLGVDTRHRTLPFPSGVEQVTMHPLTFEEFLLAQGENHMAAAIRNHAETLEPYPAHREALRLFRLYQAVGGFPRVVREYVDSGDIDNVRVQQREIDETYTADMADPHNGISGIAARRVWDSIPAQLMRSSTKKFKYSEVERGGRRAKLLEPLEWLASAGAIYINQLTECTEAPLFSYSEDEGSFFKVYLADTGLMFYKLRLNPRIWLESFGLPTPLLSPDFNGALAENSVMQALSANGLQTYYWRPPSAWGGQGELDFLLQDDQGRIIPIEVKSGRNVTARTLATFVHKARCPYAIVLSEDDFAASRDSAGNLIHHLPLYAAFCIG